MATFNERISVVIDVVTDKATKGFKDFRTAVGEANGFTGKLKAGVSSLGSVFTGAVAGPAALGTAVAAAGAFAWDAINDFADLGEQVGNFSQATGLAAEDASRWLEVAGDLSIEAGTLQSTIGRLNKTIDPDLFKRLGVSIAQTSSGAVDINGTFLNVINRLRDIKDPAERARVGAQLLGKGWQSVAPLIARSAKDIKDQLGSVADVKVFDKDKIKKAQDYKKAMDDLKDAVQEVALQIGEELMPVVTDVIGPIAKMAGAVRDLNDAATGGNGGKAPLFQFIEETGNWAESITDWLGLGDAMEYTGESITHLGDSATSAARYGGLLAEQQQRIADHTYNAKDSLDQARTALKKYQDQIKGRNDLIDLVTELDDISTKLNGITMLHTANEISDRDYWLQSAQLVGDAQVAVSDYLDTLNELPPTVKTKLLAEFDPNAPQKFLEDLQAELDRRKVKIGVVPRYVTGPQDGPNTDPRNTTPRPGDNSGNTKGESASGFGRNTSGPVNITVNVPPGANLVDIGRATADALAAFYRSGGERP